MHLMSAVIIPFFREWGRLSFVQIFALQTWFMLMCFLMEVPTGAVADRFGRKVSVALGSFLLAAASILYGTLPHLAVFVAAEALFAVAIATSASSRAASTTSARPPSCARSPSTRWRAPRSPGS
jgi:fucose permease